MRPRVAGAQRRRLLHGADRPPADDHGAPVRPARCSVLYNRCPHRGAMLVRRPQAAIPASAFICSYHAWQLPHRRQRASAIPLAKGYEGTRLTRGQPRLQREARSARRQLPRLRVREPGGRRAVAQRVPRAEAKIAFDDMCDRAPEGEVEVVPICFRVIQHSNWKFFLENQLDALHPSVTHQSTGRAAGEVEKRRSRPRRRSRAALLPLPLAFASPFEQWDSVQTINYPARPLHPQGLHGPAAARPGHARPTRR